MKSSIRALAELVLQNIDALEADCARRGAEVPSLQDPYQVGSDFTLEDAGVQKASAIIVAAAQQLIQTIQTPQVNLLTSAYAVSFQKNCLFFFFCDFTLRPRPQLRVRFVLRQSSTSPIFSKKQDRRFVLL